ncbi:MAG: hypothetical protein DBX47_04375 [Clostridiales bacterium]|nr:MAG: hypothetical protein DBX47_04375 [Clostridiales bacterium]
MGKGQKTNVGQDEELLLTKKSNSAKAKKNNSAKKKREFPIFTVFCVVVGILLTAFITQSVLENNGFYTKQKVVMSVGDTSINAVEFSYFYNQTRNYYTSLYSQYGILKADTDIKKTQCSFDTTKTWAEWFVDAAAEQLKQTLYLYNEAEKAGLALTDEQKKSKDQMYESIDSVCKEYNISRAAYFTRMYANGFNEGDFERLAKISLMADAQQTSITGTYSYTDEQLQAYYEANKKTFDKYTYRSKAFSYTEFTEDSSKSAEENEAAKAAAEKSKADAEKNANDFLALVSDADSFKLAAYNLLTNDDKKKQDEEKTDPTLTTDGSYSDNDKGNWLADTARAEGDKTVINDASSKQFVVLYYISSQRLEYNLANLKHIQINIEDAKTEDTATAEEKAKAEQEKKNEAKAKADEVYNKFNETGANEEAFNALVADYTNDTNTAQTEGLIENVKKGTYGTAFDEWVFAADRKAGDCTIIELEGSYEVVFYLNASTPCWKYDAETGKKNEDWSAYIEQLKTQYAEGLVYDEKNAKLTIA